MSPNGHHLGTLCFMDKRPRDLDAGQCTLINNMSAVITRRLIKEVGPQPDPGGGDLVRRGEDLGGDLVRRGEGIQALYLPGSY